MIILIAIFFGFSFITGIAAFFFSWGAKEEIASADPEYFQQLYRSGSSQFFANQWSLRPYVLFTEDPPASVAGTVGTLRMIYGAFLACLGVLAASFMLSVVFAKTA